MSLKPDDQVVIDKGRMGELPASQPESDNGWIVDSSIPDSVSETLSEGRAICRACGRAFVPDRSRKDFCDHACYSNWRASRVSLVDRFWAKVNKTETCWLWTAATRGIGYGYVVGRRVNGRQVRTMAHRFAWELMHGPVPVGLLVLHRCDVPACVNPDHLFLGTAKDNALDALAKGRLIGRNGQVLKAAAQPLGANVQQHARTLHGANQSRQFSVLRSA